ncbi:hypothetical protein LguiA_019254 [Lonicera macranthoides]
MKSTSSMMAVKSLLIRPHLVAPVFFRSQLCTKPYLSIPRVSLSRKSGLQPCPGCQTKSESIITSLRRSFSGVRATTHQVNDSGSVDSPLMQSMQKKIKEHVNAESVTVIDANGDGRHVTIDVISSAFEGQSAVNRQRMVYKAIWEELQNTVHAVDQMTTRTPSEAA